jgi:hypothetical protein
MNLIRLIDLRHLKWMEEKAIAIKVVILIKEKFYKTME